MKLKHILLTILAAGILSACISEENIAQPPAGDVSLNLSLKMQDVQTKAIGDAGTPYEYATPEELNVSECAVALFRLSDDVVPVPGELISFTLETGPERTVISATNDTLAYRIADIPAKTGKVRVLVIANSTEDYSELKTYAAFKEAIETTQFTSSFNPSTLVKVGYIDMELTADNYEEDIIVPMVQLAARVDLNIIVDMEKEVTKEEIRYPVEVSNVFDLFEKATLNSATAKKPYETPDGIYKAWVCEEVKAHLEDKGITKYVNPVTGAAADINFQGKIIEIEGGLEGITIDSVIQTYQWALRLNAITINNIQTQSNVILEAVNSLPLASCAWKEDLNLTVSNTYKTTFYTYEKKLYENNDPEVLTVSIDADLVKGITTTTKRFGVKIHGIWVNRTTGIQLSGWSEGGDRFVAAHNEIITTGAVTDSFTEESGSQSLSGIFTVKINPKETDPDCNTDGVIHGNLYSADVIFRSGFKEPQLQYNVVGWGTKSKVIPSFD